MSILEDIREEYEVIRNYNEKIINSDDWEYINLSPVVETFEYYGTNNVKRGTDMWTAFLKSGEEVVVYLKEEIQ